MLLYFAHSPRIYATPLYPGETIPPRVCIRNKSNKLSAHEPDQERGNSGGTRWHIPWLGRERQAAGVGGQTTRYGWGYTRSSKTYRYELHNLVPVVDILLDVDCQGGAHQRVQEEVFFRAGIVRRRRHIRRMGGMVGVVASSAVGGRACWCHGSCPRSSWAAMLQGASALIPSQCGL